MDDAGSMHGNNIGDVNDFQDVERDQVGSTREIKLPPLTGGVV